MNLRPSLLALALIAFGFAGTLAIGRLGGGGLTESAQSGDPGDSW